MYRASLKHSDAIFNIVDPKVHPRLIPTLIQQLKNPEIYIFITDDNDALVTYLPTYGDVPWASTHSVKKSGCPGRKLKELYLESGIWMVENTPCTTVTAIIPEDMKHHQMFLAHCGAERVAEIDQATIYVFRNHRLKEFKEKLKCLKHYQH